MKNNRPFALHFKKSHKFSPDQLVDAALLIILAVTVIFTSLDIISDIGEGASALHLMGEGIITLFSLIGFLVLWKRTQWLKKEVLTQKEINDQSEQLNKKALAEAMIWKKEASSLMKGLSDAIDDQLTRWQLSSAEKEVALLLLKGLSLKQVAEVRGVSEKTARSQSFSIYAKSGLAGRAELSAFFLEDLMSPNDSLKREFKAELNH